MSDVIKDFTNYVDSVRKRAEEYYMPSYTIDKSGNKKYPPDYVEENNLDKAKLLWFFRSVGYDEEICEAVLHPKALSIRNEILSTPLSELMITSKMKELWMLLMRSNVPNE